MKSILTILVICFMAYGVKQGDSLDRTISKEIDGAIPVAIHEEGVIDYIDSHHGDTIVMKKPFNDSEESFNSKVSAYIFGVEYLGSHNNVNYTMEYYDGAYIIRAIDSVQFPYWRIADSIEGVTSRGTDTWFEVANKF